MNVRTWLIPVIASYLTGRRCSVRFNNKHSSVPPLPASGRQGTILGMLMYLVNSNSSTDCVPQDMRYKWEDDCSILELVLLGGLLTQYNFKQHVASDIGIDELYLPCENFRTQSYLNSIEEWTEANLMKLNESKCNYMVFRWAPPL